MSRFKSRMAKPVYAYYLYKYESPSSQDQGSIIIVKQNKASDQVDVFTDSYFEYGDVDRPWQKEKFIKESKSLSSFFNPSSGIVPSPLNKWPFGSLDEARFEALRAQLGISTSTHIDQSKPFAWIAFTQLIFVAALFAPGVSFFGSVYSLIAQVMVVVSTLMNNAPFIMTSCRLSTGVVLGNLLLCFLLWNSSYSTVEKVEAALRASVVLVSGFAIVCSNEYLISIVRPSEKQM